MNPELPPKMAAVLAWVHAQPWLRRFTLMNRLLLAMAFLPTGMVKLMGDRFTTLPVDNPVGFFFEAMYRTGPYWHFLGLVQVLAAVLLLIPRTVTLGAMLFAPVVVSILLITTGIGFGGTVPIVAGMVLATTYLICWDADKIWAAVAPLIRRRTGGGLLQGMNAVEATGWILGGTVGMGMFLATRSLVPTAIVPALFWTGIGAFGLVILGWITGAARRAASYRSSGARISAASSGRSR